MRMIVALALLTSGYSTVSSRLSEEPQLTRTTTVSVDAFNQCFVLATGKESVSYLPAPKGGMFKATAGPQDYVFWIVSIADQGSSRLISIRGVNEKVARQIARKVDACSGG